MNFKYKFKRIFRLTLSLLLSAVFCESGATEVMAENQSDNSVSVATWNIQVGSDYGPNSNGWPKRKSALIEALRSINPDVLCTQEGNLRQLKYIDEALPNWKRIGVGRDNGKNEGEFCAIFYNSNRLKILKSGTFWLSSTPESPKNTWDTPYKRICTHALFRDKKSSKKFAVLSTHFPVNEDVSIKAATLVTQKIATLYAGKPIFLCGDFNCEPDTDAWKEFAKMSLDPSDPDHVKTWMSDGVPVACLDAIFHSRNISIIEQKILNSKYNNIYPSDHFGLYTKGCIQ